MQKKSKIKQKKIKCGDSGNAKLLIYFFVALVLIYSMNKYFQYAENKILNNCIKTIGTISEAGGNSIAVSYTYNKKQYKVIIGPPYYSIRNNEQYFTCLNPSDLSDIVVEFWHPYINKKYFLTTKPIAIQYGFLDRINNDIVFEYIVNKVPYKRYQKLPPKSNTIRELDKYIIFYKIDDPKIAYLYILSQGLPI